MSPQEKPGDISADISVEETLTEAETERIFAGLLAGDPTPRRYHAIVLSLRTQDGQLVGALMAATVWTWLSIDLLWVDPSLRGHYAQLNDFPVGHTQFQLAKSLSNQIQISV